MLRMRSRVFDSSGDGMQQPTCALGGQGGGAREGGDPVEALSEQARVRHVGQRPVQAPEDGDGRQGRQAPCMCAAPGPHVNMQDYENTHAL